MNLSMPRSSSWSERSTMEDSGMIGVIELDPIMVDETDCHMWTEGEELHQELANFGRLPGSQSVPSYRSRDPPSLERI